MYCFARSRIFVEKRNIGNEPRAGFGARALAAGKRVVGTVGNV